MRRGIILLSMCILGAPLCGSAGAISILEDTIQSLGFQKTAPVFARPAAFGSNYNRQRATATDTPALQSPTSDLGPDADSPPVAAAIGAVPSMVILSRSMNPTEDYLCAGVLVDANWVLTAAHCTLEVARRWPKESPLYIFTGRQELASPGPSFSVMSVVTHPQFDAKTLRNDLALLRIDAKSAALGPPMRLDGMPSAKQVGEIGTILGWGISTNAAEQQTSSRLQLIQATVQDPGVCFSTPNFPIVLSSSVFCARSILKYRDVCSRFGGSPLLMFDLNGQVYLAGLVSWSANCSTESRKPNVYLDVQIFVPWIKSVIAAKSSF